MYKTPFFNQTSKRLSVVITIWFLSYQISMAQLTCTQMSIDTMSVKIGLVDIGLKHVQRDTFRAYVYDKQGFSTFLFNSSTQQIASPVKTYKETYYDGLELISIFNTQPHNSSMRNTLNKVCRGIYHGPYSIVGVEEGFMENNLLNGTAYQIESRKLRLARNYFLCPWNKTRHRDMYQWSIYKQMVLRRTAAHNDCK